MDKYLQYGRIQWYKYLQKPRKTRFLAQKEYYGNYVKFAHFGYDVKCAHFPLMEKVKKHEKNVS